MKVKIIVVPPKNEYGHFRLNQEPQVSKYLGEKLINNGFAEFVDHTWGEDLEIVKDEEE